MIRNLTPVSALNLMSLVKNQAIGIKNLCLNKPKCRFRAANLRQFLLSRSQTFNLPKSMFQTFQSNKREKAIRKARINSRLNLFQTEIRIV